MLAEYLIIIGKIAFIMLFALVMLPVLIYVERKGSAFIQDRAGPNRAAIGPIRTHLRILFWEPGELQGGRPT